MARVRGWEIDFVAAINLERAKAFEWGRADCATLMGASVRACQGRKHPALKVLKRYATKIGAARLLSAEGSMANVLAQHFEEVPAMLAQTGDIGLLVGDDGVEAGCVVDQARAIGRHPVDGFFFVPVTLLTKVYRV